MPEIKSLFGFVTDDASIQAAFLEPRLDFFYDRILVPRPGPDFRGEVDVPFIIGNLDFYPPRRFGENLDDQFTGKGDYEGAIAAIKEGLNQPSPLLLAGIRVMHEMPAQQPADPNKYVDDLAERGVKSHALLITGYKRVRNPDGVSYDAVRVMNSWGKAWQESFKHEGQDGWVKARALLDHTFYHSKMLTWHHENKILALPETLALGGVIVTSQTDWKVTKGKLATTPPVPACRFASLTGNASVQIAVQPSALIPPAEINAFLKAGMGSGFAFQHFYRSISVSRIHCGDRRRSSTATTCRVLSLSR